MIVVSVILTQKLSRPSKTPILTTPHRLQNYNSIWTKIDNGGLFYHFDGFRYQPYGPFGNDDTVQRFVRVLVINANYRELRIII